MLLHRECAAVRHVGANAFIPVKLRLKPAPALFTRRFEAQLHWEPVGIKRPIRRLLGDMFYRTTCWAALPGDLRRRKHPVIGVAEGQNRARGGHACCGFTVFQFRPSPGADVLVRNETISTCCA